MSNIIIFNLCLNYDNFNMSRPSSVYLEGLHINYVYKT
jgi:hypothetical protein